MVTERSGQIAEAFSCRTTAANSGSAKRQSFDALEVVGATSWAPATEGWLALCVACRSSLSIRQSWRDLEEFISTAQDEDKKYRHGACNLEKKLTVHKKLCAITRILLSELNLSLVQGRVANIGSSVLRNGSKRWRQLLVSGEVATFWRVLSERRFARCLKSTIHGSVASVWL
jgi:hypothetical protein